MMGYNYTMMKVNKTELDKITFVHKNERMNILGIKIGADAFVRLGDGDNYTLVSQTPSMKVANGRCTERPGKYLCMFIIATVSWLLLLCHDYYYYVMITTTMSWLLLLCHGY